MTVATDERLDTLSTRYVVMQEAIAAMDCEIEGLWAGREMRGERLGIIRPATKFVGWTDEDVIEAAQRMGRDPFAADWWCDLDTDVMADFAPGRFGKSKIDRANKDTAQIERLEAERAVLEAEAVIALADLETAYEAATRAQFCAGSGYDIGDDVGRYAYRLCPCCSVLQQVEDGCLIEHRAPDKRIEREAA